jgi:hypothetical protein
MLAADCICTFQVCHIGILRRHYPDSSKEVMYTYGNGFKSTDLKESGRRKRKRTTEFIIDETMIKIDWF